MALVKGKLVLPLVLMAAFALSRIPGLLPPGLTAAYALAFCGGVYFSRGMAWWLPLGTLTLTDVFLNVFYYHRSVFSGYLLVTLLAFAGIVALGRWFKPSMSWLRLLGGGLFGALLFYFVTNTAAWLFDPGYAKTLAGWIQALTRGLPGYPPAWEFFRNTLLSGGLFTALFVGTVKLSAPAESPIYKEAGVRAEAPEAEPAETPEEAKA